MRDWERKTDAKYKISFNRNFSLSGCTEPHSRDWEIATSPRPPDNVVRLCETERVSYSGQEYFTWDDPVPWEVSDKWIGDETIVLYD